MIISKSFRPRTEEGFGNDIFFSTNSNLVFFDEIEGKPSLTKVMAARVKEDEILQGKIATEVQDRKDADEALEGRITSLEADNTENIASISNLQTEDNNIKTSISNLQTALQTEDNNIKESIKDINALIGDVPEETDTLYNLIVGLQNEDSNINSLIGEAPEVSEGEEVPTLYSSIATLQEENVNIKALIGEKPEEEWSILDVEHTEEAADNISGLYQSLLKGIDKDKDLSEEEIRTAALLASYFSQGRNSSSVPVNYCLISQLRKPNKAALGFVTLTNYKTIYIDPSEEVIEQLLKQYSK